MREQPHPRRTGIPTGYRPRGTDHTRLEPCSPLEHCDTRSAIVEDLRFAAVPFPSLLLPERLVGLAEWLYLANGPLLTWNGIRDGRARRPPEAAIKGES